MEKKIELKLLLYCFTITPHPSICSKKFYFFKFLKDDLDYDQEFKIKCEANLKLSKKLKTKSVKHQKKLMESLEVLDGGSTTSAAARTTDPTSKSLNSINKKSKKKGYATTKQRLGKLLKLNRLVNI